MSDANKLHDSEPDLPGEMGMVLQEIRRLGRAVDGLTEKLDERLGELGREVADAKVREAVLRTQLEAAQAEIAALKSLGANHATEIGTLKTATAVTGTKLALIIAGAGSIAAGLLKLLSAVLHN